MKQNILQNSFLYRPREAIRFTVRLDRELREPILWPTVQLAATRYPYLCVEVNGDAGNRKIGVNTRPVPVFRGRKPRAALSFCRWIVTTRSVRCGSTRRFQNAPASPVRRRRNADPAVLFYHQFKKGRLFGS